MNGQVAQGLHLRGRTGISTAGDWTMSEVHFGFLVARRQKGKERSEGRRTVVGPREWSGDDGAGGLDLPGRRGSREDGEVDE